MLSDLLVEAGDAPLNVVNQDLVEGPREIRNAEVVAVLLVDRMLAKEVPLALHGLQDGDAIEDLLLAAALAPKVTQLERIDLALKKLQSISSLVHQVYLGDDANRPVSFRVDLASQLKSV